jgi:hypothetical protein
MWRATVPPIAGCPNIGVGTSEVAPRFGVRSQRIDRLRLSTRQYTHGATYSVSLLGAKRAERLTA